MISAEMPQHWSVAAGRLGICLDPGHLLKLPNKHRVFGKDCEVAWVEFKTEDFTDNTWATTSFMVDIIGAKWLESQGYKLDPKTGVVARYISLSVQHIDLNNFVSRYPDVPDRLRHDFVLLHELGHVVAGRKEADADEYAFKYLGLTKDEGAWERRQKYYELIEKRHAKLFNGK